MERDGWRLLRQHGSHQFFAHDSKPGLVVGPIHVGRTLKLGLVHDILKDAGISVDQLRELR
ncbi:MAG TPA: type II toxin-antitoxin system HicA family toxin [Chloroflexota bacterium]|nr:type II toxin-antitoxin system HicA family toxin [Chloroflexota bacterium]